MSEESLRRGLQQIREYMDHVKALIRDGNTEIDPLLNSKLIQNLHRLKLQEIEYDSLLKKIRLENRQFSSLSMCERRSSAASPLTPQHRSHTRSTLSRNCCSPLQALHTPTSRMDSLYREVAQWIGANESRLGYLEAVVSTLLSMRTDHQRSLVLQLLQLVAAVPQNTTATSSLAVFPSPDAAVGSRRKSAPRQSVDLGSPSTTLIAGFRDRQTLQDEVEEDQEEEEEDPRTHQLRSAVKKALNSVLRSLLAETSELSGRDFVFNQDNRLAASICGRMLANLRHTVYAHLGEEQARRLLTGAVDLSRLLTCRFLNQSLASCLAEFSRCLCRHVVEDLRLFEITTLHEEEEEDVEEVWKGLGGGREDVPRMEDVDSSSCGSSPTSIDLRLQYGNLEEENSHHKAVWSCENQENNYSGVSTPISTKDLAGRSPQLSVRSSLCLRESNALSPI